MSSFVPGNVMGRPQRGAVLATGSSGNVQRGLVKPKLPGRDEDVRIVRGFHEN